MRHAACGIVLREAAVHADICRLSAQLQYIHRQNISCRPGTRAKLCVIQTLIELEIAMKIRTTLAAAIAATVLLTATGCAVSRGQQTVGAYVDDAGITTLVKTRMLEDKQVAGTSISVETLNGTVMLSGFAKNSEEKYAAQRIAQRVDGVKMVKNEIVVRP
jgi:hypothetical protein